MNNKQKTKMYPFTVFYTTVKTFSNILQLEFGFSQERRRLRERYPSMALSAQDAEACRLTLISYEGLALSNEICEGKCAMGRTCPTGLCRQPSKRYIFFYI